MVVIALAAGCSARPAAAPAEPVPVAATAELPATGPEPAAGAEMLPVRAYEPVDIRLTSVFEKAGSDEITAGALERLREAVAPVSRTRVLRVEVESKIVGVRVNRWGNAPANRLNQLRANAAACELREMGFTVAGAVGKDPIVARDIRGDQRVLRILSAD